MSYLDEEDEKKAEKIISDMQEYIEIQTSNYNNDILKIVAMDAKFKVPIGKPDIPSLRSKLIQVMIRTVKHIPNDSATHLSGRYYIQQYNDYLEMIYQLSSKFIIRQDKITFCLFVGINITIYNALLESGDEEQMEAMQTIDSCLIDETLTGMENSKVDKTSGALRLKAKGIGHHVTTEPTIKEIGDAIYNSIQERGVKTVMDAVKKNALIGKK